MKHTIEICIPAFNEARIIAESAEAVLKVFRAAGKKVIVTVADNASEDGTADAARKIAGVSVISIPIRGKGAAVVAAARRSDADFFGFIDADLSADPSDIVPFLSLVESGKCDIAVGSRLLDSGTVDRAFLPTFLSRVFNAARKALVGVKVKDTQCGLKVMNSRGREVLAKCAEEGWFFDIEFLARAERAGLSIREVPVRWREHRFPGRKSKLNYFRDGIGAVRAIFRIKKGLRTSRS